MYFSQMAYQKNSEPIFRRRGYKDGTLAVDVENVFLPCLHNVGVLLQLDLLVIGPCSAGLRHRTWRSVKDMNGLPEMERSQVTHVTLVFGTFNTCTLATPNMCCTQYSVCRTGDVFSTRCRSSVVGCDFVSFVCSRGSVRLPSATGSVLFTRRIFASMLTRRIFASMHLACRDLGLPLVRKLSSCAGVPKKRHMLCPALLQQSRSVWLLLSGIGFDRVGFSP